jgi:pyruvate dehydrogenase E2 component (dihydrolipoamide acetyltransferase)
VPKRADGRVIATPYAKKLAKELGVDLSTIAGTGPEGRVTASDIEALKGGGELTQSFSYKLLSQNPV